MARSKYPKRKDGRRYHGIMIDGKRKYFYGKTDAEIDAKIAAWKAQQTAPETMLFADVADSWWKIKREDLAKDTEHGYVVAARRAKAEFHDKRIKEITAHDIYAFLLKFKAQDYSQKVINNTRTVLKEIYDHAFIIGEVDINPVLSVPPVKGKPKEPRQPASDADVKEIEKSRTESITARMFYFMLYTGARLGEACALQWKDIDLDRKTASVHKTLAYGNSSTPSIKNCPKTKAGIRELQLLDNVLEALPPQGEPEQYLFYPEGLPRRAARDTAIAEYKEKHDLQCTPHQLRHSYASFLHAAGTDVKSAQTLLGHSSIVMTQDIYTHLDAKAKSNVRDSLNEYIKRGTTPEV